MLEVFLPEQELYDEANEVFVTSKPITLRLEHSLLSISKWESKWQIPFMSEKQKTNEQMYDYICAMSVGHQIDESVVKRLSPAQIGKISDYIDSPMTATTFQSYKPSGRRETITSELVYYWMITYGIPFECQKWHLNRLLALIRVCAVKSDTRKMSKNDVAKSNTELNRLRRSKLNSKG